MRALTGLCLLVSVCLFVAGFWVMWADPDACVPLWNPSVSPPNGYVSTAWAHLLAGAIVVLAGSIALLATVYAAAKVPESFALPR